jgi:hypothetical protein
MTDAPFVPLDVLSVRLGLPREWLKVQAEAGRIPFLMVNNRWMFHAATVEASLAGASQGIEHETLAQLIAERIAERLHKPKKRSAALDDQPLADLRRMRVATERGAGENSVSARLIRKAIARKGNQAAASRTVRAANTPLG